MILGKTICTYKKFTLYYNEIPILYKVISNDDNLFRHIMKRASYIIVKLVKVQYIATHDNSITNNACASFCTFD